METIAGKILCIFGILVLRLMFGLMPCSLRNPLKRLASSSPTKRKYFAMLVSLLNCFAAGTLLSSCLLHLFPACHAILEGISGEDLSRKKFPLAEMLTVFGLFLLLLIDRGIHCVHRNRCGEFSTRTRSKESISSATTGNTTPMTYSLNRHRINPDDEFDMSDIIAENHIEAVPPKKSSPLRISESPDPFPVEPGLPVEHTEFQFLYVNSPGRKSPCLAIFFVISLSVQSMFTNMALGLQSRDIELWTLFVALALREIVQSFTLGLELDRHTNKRYQSLIGAIGFSVLSALGIVIGTGFESLTFYHESAVTLLGVLLSITNGAILYTVFFDILYHEMLKDYEFPKPIASLIGFGFMTLLIGIVH